MRGWAEVILRTLLAAALSLALWSAFATWMGDGWGFQAATWAALLLVPVVAGAVTAFPGFRPKQIMLGAVAAALVGPWVIFVLRWEENTYDNATAVVVIVAISVCVLSLVLGTAVAAVVASLRWASLNGRESAHR